ncbi:putative UDPgalactose-glucose galactosyltransferase [Chlamydiales bacterium STE3]|nr:putative UDPgalactose-glucose galactosyltransferase [Chlamydiales bacterium STE3]
MEAQRKDQQLAVIVPYRDREEHLKQFVPHLQGFLRDQPHRIYIIEQASGKSFNRGKLLNIGFSKAKGSCDYVCFHDIDMLPVEADYSYSEVPTHLATHVEQFKFAMPYPDYFGGVTLFNLHDFALINGYHNDYFGWGLEDDDLRLRCFLHGLTVQSRSGTFLSLEHKHAEEIHPDTQRNRRLFEKFYQGEIAMLANGLDSLAYNLIETQATPDYTKILVEL